MKGKGDEEESMNKFSEYFSEDMTSEQARKMSYSLLKTIKKQEEIKELVDAFNQVNNVIMDRELDGAWRKGAI